MNIAVIGAGYWGRNHIRTFDELDALYAICDSDPERREYFKGNYPDAVVYGNYNDVLRDKNVDGVVVATPSATHYDISMQSMLAGKAVLVEKPMALWPSQGETLVSISNGMNVPLMVGHLLLYHKAFLRLVVLERSGYLGELKYMCSNRLNLGKIRREENILWSFAPHDISMMLHLSGSLPARVSSSGLSFLNEKVADSTVTHLEWGAGLKAHIYVSWLHPFKEHRFVAIGSEKMAVFDDTRPWGRKLTVFPYAVTENGNSPLLEKGDPEYQELSFPEQPLKAECRHFLDCIESGKRPLTDGSHGLDVLRVLSSAQMSLSR